MGNREAAKKEGFFLLLPFLMACDGEIPTAIKLEGGGDKGLNGTAIRKEHLLWLPLPLSGLSGLKAFSKRASYQIN